MAKNIPLLRSLKKLLKFRTPYKRGNCLIQSTFRPESFRDTLKIFWQNSESFLSLFAKPSESQKRFRKIVCFIETSPKSSPKKSRRGLFCHCEISFADFKRSNLTNTDCFVCNSAKIPCI